MDRVDLIVQLQLYNSINSLILLSMRSHKIGERQGFLRESSGSNHIPVDVADLKKKIIKKESCLQKEIGCRVVFIIFYAFL